jgi:hypothetical protein
MSNSGLKRRVTFEEALHLPGPNLDLPQRISSSIIDSPYLIKLLGDDLGTANDLRQEQEDQARAVERHAQQQNVPLAELRAVVAAMRPPADHQPFAGQAAHEARAAQQDLMAQMEAQRVGLFRWYREQQTVRQAQTSLAEQQGQSLAALAQQLASTQRRYKRSFVARPQSSSESEPGAEPRARGPGGATGGATGSGATSSRGR